MLKPYLKSGTAAICLITPEPDMAARRNGYSNRDILMKFDCLIKTKTP